MTSVQIPASAYRTDDWQRGYESLETEYHYPIQDIDGEIPADLQGTLYRNGPGRLDINGQRFHHPFDGDGMVCAISFQDGGAVFRNRYVRTEGYVAESAAGKILYRGVFGTQKPGGWLANAFDLKFKNIANTNVLHWGDRLFALWEGGLPHELDPNTLETLGPSTLGKLLKPTDPWSAHPRIDPGEPGQAPRLVNFSIKSGLSSGVTVYELNLAHDCLQQKTFTIPGFAFIHDFAITPNYYLFFQNPVVLNPLPFVFGFRGAGQCIEFKPQKPTRIWVLPRHRSGSVQVFETDPCFVFHHANAHEIEGHLIVDSICYPSFPKVDPQEDYRQIDFNRLPAGELWRFKINLAQRTVTHDTLVARCCEFPTLHPHQMGRPYRFIFMGTAHEPSGNAPLQALLKLDLDNGTQTVWSAAPQGFIGEPIFVPHPQNTDEDAGWLLSLVYDAAQHRTDVVILDAQDLAKGPIARLHLTHPIPYGLHGCFKPQVFLRDS
ncbi:MAG: carotenoid oxygenase family protein [Thermosynechococcaceae cyanobacterium]